MNPCKKRLYSRLYSALAIAALSALTTAQAQSPSKENASHYWPEWRGPLSSGVALYADPPVEWSEEKNIRWKIALPGPGHSTPVIWGDLVFLTTAIPYGAPLEPQYDRAQGAHDNRPVNKYHQFDVLAISRSAGKIVWQETAAKELPKGGGHYTGSLASNSPVTDGEHVFAFFGSRGIYCYDMDGQLKWKKNLGEMKTRHAHGEGSSPALHGQTLIINWDHEGGSFVIALDKRNGKQLWKVARKEMTSWSTPLIVEFGDRAQVIISATNRVRSYDLATGEVIWECGGLSRNVVASPVAGNGLVFVSNSYDWQAMLAIRLKGARGDITDSNNIAWRLDRLTPYVPSPMLYKGTLYFLRHNQGILTGLDAETGDFKLGPFRLSGIREVFASPVAAADRVYITDRQGTTLVFSHGNDPQPLALNRLNDSFSASPALVDNELYLRGESYLYSIAEKK